MATSDMHPPAPQPQYFPKDDESSAMSQTFVNVVKGAAKRLRRDGGGTWTRTLEDASKQVTESAKANSERMREATDNYLGHVSRAATEIGNVSNASKQSLEEAMADLTRRADKAGSDLSLAVKTASESMTLSCRNSAYISNEAKEQLSALAAKVSDNWNKLWKEANAESKKLRAESTALHAEIHASRQQLGDIGHALRHLKDMTSGIRVLFFIGWVVCMLGVVWISLDPEIHTLPKLIVLVGGLILGFAMGARLNSS